MRREPMSEAVRKYRSDYRRGWKASQGFGPDRQYDSPLEMADGRGEPGAWYDGYMDYACDRPMYHSQECQDDGHRTCDMGGLALATDVADDATASAEDAALDTSIPQGTQAERAIETAHTAITQAATYAQAVELCAGFTLKFLRGLADLVHVDVYDMKRKAMVAAIVDEIRAGVADRSDEAVMTPELVTLASATLSDVFTPDGTAVVVDAVRGDYVATSDGETYRLSELTPSRGLLAIMESETASAMTTAVITTAVANTPRHAVRDIVAVAYGQFVAAYPLDLESQAKAVFVTAIGANVDATLFYMTYQEWMDARAKLPTNVTVFDRTSAADAIIRERA